MKQPKHNKYILLVLLLLFFQQYQSKAQDDTSGQQIVKLHYFNLNNKMQYLQLESMLKKNKVLSPVQNKNYQVYLDESSAGNLIGSATTNDDGKARIFIPVSLKPNWDSADTHTFLVNSGNEEIISDYSITKARVNIDTSTVDGTRNITVTIQKLKHNEWIPAKDVEMKVGIERLGGILSAGDEETYTTDSTGIVSVEFKKDNLPGDQKGMITLAVKVDDNEELGNLLSEKQAAWGIATKPSKDFFNQRTLWSTRFHTPYWLLFMAYSIAFIVWGTLIYLLFQLARIRRQGSLR